MTTEPETQPQEPDGESQVPDDDERRAGVLWLLGLGFFVALIACMFAQAHARDGVKLAQEFGVELSVLGRLYANAGAAVFAFPVVVLLAGLGVTKAGRVRHKIGLMLGALLFAFALLWAAGAMAAFSGAYDPPRAERHPTGVAP